MVLLSITDGDVVTFRASFRDKDMAITGDLNGFTNKPDLLSRLAS
jgi:phosphoribosyl 1,2-cyclic phosphodiesterase